MPLSFDVDTVNCSEDIGTSVLLLIAVICNYKGQYLYMYMYILAFVIVMFRAFTFTCTCRLLAINLEIVNHNNPLQVLVLPICHYPVIKRYMCTCIVDFHCCHTICYM